MSNFAPVTRAFESRGVIVPIAAIVDLSPLRPTTKSSAKYRQILNSVRVLGLVEPPVVIPAPDQEAHYLLLDGRLRIEALKDIGVNEVACLLATDDESYTYNKRINRIAPAQEHRMILRALDRGVTEQALASALNLDVVTIRRRVKLMNGISAPVVELLKDTQTPIVVFDVLRKMRPLRQLNVAQLMVNQQNFTHQFARALLSATPAAQLIAPDLASSKAPAARTNLPEMEEELLSLQTQIRAVESSFGTDALHLTVAKGYLAKLISSPRIVRWLEACRPEYLEEFRSIVQMTRLDSEGNQGPSPAKAEPNKAYRRAFRRRMQNRPLSSPT